MPARYAFVLFGGLLTFMVKLGPTPDAVGAMSGVAIAACITAVISATADFIIWKMRKI